LIRTSKTEIFIEWLQGRGKNWGWACCDFLSSNFRDKISYNEGNVTAAGKSF